MSSGATTRLEDDEVGVRVELRVPGDKSITHRALLLAALAEGESRLRGLLPAADPRATARALRALGIDVPPIPVDGAEIVVRGVGLRGMREPAETIDCGNSGTTARLLLGLLAGRSFTAILTGDESLRTRPMGRVTSPLGRMGASFEELGESDRLPIRVRGGALRPIAFDGPRASAQVKSAILLAGLVGGVPVRVREPAASRDHTERMLRACGVDVRVEHAADAADAADGANSMRDAIDIIDDGAASAGPREIALAPAPALEPLDLDVPGDFSSAAFLLVVGSLAREGPLRIRGVGVNPTRTGFLDPLRRMGGRVELENRREVGGEPVADILVRPASRLCGTTVGATEIPSMIDEVPALAVLAARADGETVIAGAAELRVKESDRLAALASNLRALGVEVDERADGLVIRGTDARLTGRVLAFGDHRIAMAFGALGAAPDTEIAIDDARVVDVSYPGFWEDLRLASTTRRPE
ncbi:MAG: 3-phosphoshikimate 1-carboxyvinyltransferase [Gemmatimonadota bacterium]